MKKAGVFCFMKLKYKNGSNVSDSISLLISILVRYPEVASINYEPNSHVLRFTFMCTKKIAEGDSFFYNVISCLETYNFFQNRKAKVIGLSHSQYNQLTAIEIQRDVHTLTAEEIALIISLMHDQFPQELISDENDYLLEEDLLVQEELICHMLEMIKDEAPSQKIIAFREDGRVLVFNK
jgi:predicted XRE-type DNA-binding protein